jgi:hypothetical protein
LTWFLDAHDHSLNVWTNVHKVSLRAQYKKGS